MQYNYDDQGRTIKKNHQAEKRAGTDWMVFMHECALVFSCTKEVECVRIWERAGREDEAGLAVLDAAHLQPPLGLLTLPSMEVATSF